MMKLPPMIEHELETCTGRWEIRNGGKHFKLILDGYLVGILPRGQSMGEKSGRNRGMLNLRSNIRRHLALHPC